MRTATWEDIRTIELSDLPEPAPSPADIVIDMAACGICGSDVHSFVEGAWIAKGMALGHEFAGTVRQVGSSVSGLAIGDRVAMNPASYCGECDRCRDGHANLCRSMAGSSGGFGDRILIRNAVPGVNVFAIPDEISFEAAAFLEPMSVAMRAVLETAPDLSEPILVTGLGTIGQCVVQILHALGAGTVVGVDTSALRREAGERSGATETIDPAAVDVVAHLLERYGTTSSPYRVESGAFGTAFECAGAPAVFDQVFQLVRAAGAVSLVALTAAPVVLDPNPVVQKELRLRGSFAYTTRDCQEAFALIARGAVHPEQLISHRFALADIEEAFEVQSHSDSSVKVMVHP